MTLALTIAQARRVAVAAQGLHTVGGGTTSAIDVLARLGCVQVDSMSAVRRSHELVFLSRGVQPGTVHRVGRAEGETISFEGMAHALSLVSVELWPAFGFRRRRTKRYGWRGPQVDQVAVTHARRRLDAEGRVRLSDFGKTTGSGWDRESPYRWALEWLAATGGAVCVDRDRWQRVYSLPELAIPDPIRNVEMSDEACIQELCRRAADALGIATTKDVADYFRLRPAEARAGLNMLGLDRATLDGWQEPVWMSPLADPSQSVDERAVTALSPFDSLVWTRDRLHRLFGKDYRLEAYKPAAKRTFGYFGMPVLQGSEVVGRVALRRRDDCLVVENVELDSHASTSTREQAINTVARWTNCKTVIYEGVSGG